MNITPIIEALVKLVVAVLCVAVIPYLKEKYTTAQLEMAYSLIKIAVQAAEQIYTSEQGTQKKEYVVEYITSKGLKSLKIDTKDLDSMIEAAVLELHSALYGAEKEA